MVYIHSDGYICGIPGGTPVRHRFPHSLSKRLGPYEGPVPGTEIVPDIVTGNTYRHVIDRDAFGAWVDGWAPSESEICLGDRVSA